MDLCNIARGRLDGLIDNGSVEVDHAAGHLILTEAGGTVCDFTGTTPHKGQWDYREMGIFATNGSIDIDLS